ncbi:MAG: HNH endonuclease [Candidatus Saccharimonadales bacterium]
MSKKRSWTDEQLVEAVKVAKSYRAVLVALRLIPAGGNYDQIKKRIKELGLDTVHFTGKRWNAGEKIDFKPRQALEELLVETSFVQSFKLKNRLFREGLKEPKCELCGWQKQAADGRVPVELDHENGNKHDNRLENLRILCPNCHSLQPTHRGKNKKVKLRYARVVE